MKFSTLFLRAILLPFSLGASLLSFAGGLINPEAASVIHTNPGTSPSARGRQLATLESYLLADNVTVGLDPSSGQDWKCSGIERGIGIWSNALSDCPFVLAQSGERPMVIVKFVDSISTGGDVQGQVEATRMLHWGSSVSYQIHGTLLVRRTIGHHALNEDEITEVVAHELGHLLGLDDVSECRGLMGPFEEGAVRLEPTREEVKAVVSYRAELRAAIAKLR